MSRFPSEGQNLISRNQRLPCSHYSPPMQQNLNFLPFLHFWPGIDAHLLDVNLQIHIIHFLPQYCGFPIWNAHLQPTLLSWSSTAPNQTQAILIYKGNNENSWGQGGMRGWRFHDAGESESSCETGWRSVGGGQNCCQGSEKGNQSVHFM